MTTTKFANEAAIRDHVADTARSQGWKATTEWRLRPGAVLWGIVDLVLTKAGDQPILIEFKHHITGASELRQAATQAHSYRTIADRYFREPCAAYVVADTITATAQAHHVTLGYLDVHCHTVADILDLLAEDAKIPGYLEFRRSLDSHVYGTTGRGEHIDGMSRLLSRCTSDVLEEIVDMKAPAGSHVRSSVVYDKPRIARL